MRVTVTKEFASPEEAAAWLNVFAGGPVIAVDTAPPLPAEPSGPAVAPTPADKPKRKPRSDAGQPRGAYKTGEAPTPATEPAAPATPVAQAQEAQRAEPSAPVAAALPSNPQTGGKEPEPTMDDARGALGLLNETPGLGMPACMQHLQEFGVNRISLLPKEKFAIFIKQAKEKVAEHKAAAK